MVSFAFSNSMLSWGCPHVNHGTRQGKKSKTQASALTFLSCTRTPVEWIPGLDAPRDVRQCLLLPLPTMISTRSLFPAHVRMMIPVRVVVCR